MILYFVFAGLASQGLVVFDGEAGTVTLHVESIVLLISGVAGYVGTFYASRVAKKKGGPT